MTEGLDVLLGWAGFILLLAILGTVMHHRARRR